MYTKAPNQNVKWDSVACHTFYSKSAPVNSTPGVSRQSVNELLRERRAVSPEMSIRLGRLFGNSAEFWLNAQRAVDLWEANEVIKSDVARIQPLNGA